ncbi:hypothetical protein D3C71_1767170 [compost metagenome]
MPSGIAPSSNVRNPSISLPWISTKKKLGARSAMLPVNSRRRLPSINASVTSSARPRPSDSTTDGVSAPGRWMLPIASRSDGELTRGLRRASQEISSETRRRMMKAKAIAPRKTSEM